MAKIHELVPGTLRIPNNNACAEGGIYKTSVSCQHQQKQTPEGNQKKDDQSQRTDINIRLCSGGESKNLKGIKTRKNKKAKAKQKKTNTVHRPEHPSSPAASSSRERQRKGGRQKRENATFRPISIHPCASAPPPTTSATAPNLKAIQAPLLLLLGDGVHPLLQMRPGNLGVPPLPPLLLDLLQAPPVVLLRLVLELLELGLEVVGAAPPRVAVGPDHVLLPL